MRNIFLKATSSFLVSSVSFSCVNTAFADSAKNQEEHIFKSKLISLCLCSAAVGTVLLIFLVKYFGKPKELESTFTTQDAEARVEDTGNCPSPKKGSQKDTGSLPCNKKIDDIFEFNDPKILDSSDQNKSPDSEENLPPLGQESSDPTTKQERKKRKKIANGNGKNNNKTSILKIFKSLIFNRYTCAILVGFVILPYLELDYAHFYFLALWFIFYNLLINFLSIFFDIANKIFPSYGALISILYLSMIFLNFKIVNIVVGKLRKKSLKCNIFVGEFFKRIKDIREAKVLARSFLPFVFLSEERVGVYNFFRQLFCSLYDLDYRLNRISDLINKIKRKFPIGGNFEEKTLEEHFEEIVENLENSIDFFYFLEKLEKALKDFYNKLNVNGLKDVDNQPIVVVLGPYSKIDFRCSKEEQNKIVKDLKKEKGQASEGDIKEKVKEIEQQKNVAFWGSNLKVGEISNIRDEEVQKEAFKKLEKDKSCKELNKNLRCKLINAEELVQYGYLDDGGDAINRIFEAMREIREVRNEEYNEMIEEY